MAYSQVQLSDIEVIKDATKHYSRGVDRLDPGIMKLAYWPEASDEHGVFNGNAWEFCDFCMDAHLGWRSTMHCIFNHSIELDSDDVHAHGELYNVTYLFKADSPVLDTWYGRYVDEYENVAMSGALLGGFVFMREPPLAKARRWKSIPTTFVKAHSTDPLQNGLSGLSKKRKVASNLFSKPINFAPSAPDARALCLVPCALCLVPCALCRLSEH